MALKIPAIPTSFPIFSPATTTAHRPSSTTELRFSRWNNANAEPFNRRRRSQEQIERDIRLHRRYQSITNLTEPNPNSDSAAASTAVDFKSNGTPSSPSPPSIPGKRSKYSKPPNANPNAHPAFRRQPKPRFSTSSDPENGIVVTEKGIAYRIENAPFEFQYSYTETPKVKPLALREQPYLPFGPGTMPRPWTGRKPLPESKKKLPEFDSFKLPPAGKKGVKPVQAPGPYLMGSGPRERAMSREEVLGEPLTAEEVKELIKGSVKTRRQLNMGEFCWFSDFVCKEFMIIA